MFFSFSQGIYVTKPSIPTHLHRHQASIVCPTELIFSGSSEEVIMDNRTDDTTQLEKLKKATGSKNKDLFTDFSTNLRYVITRNIRNPWLDDRYDDVMDRGEYPTFN